MSAERSLEPRHVADTRSEVHQYELFRGGGHGGLIGLYSDEYEAELSALAPDMAAALRRLQGGLNVPNWSDLVRRMNAIGVPR